VDLEGPVGVDVYTVLDVFDFDLFWFSIADL